MKKKTQKELFKNGEGDAWFSRNKRGSSLDSPDMIVNKNVLEYLLSLPLPNSKDIKAIEVGCGEGTLLSHLLKKKKWELFGIDPSKKAIDLANNLGINGSVGTADELNFKDETFDLIILGFCLYLCDTCDLFKIANEVNRISKNNSWLIIIDFWSPDFKKVPYKHLDGIYSSKFDFSKMFSWHPSYTKFDHKLRDCLNFEYTDSQENWLSMTTLRKLVN